MDRYPVLAMHTHTTPAGCGNVSLRLTETTAAEGQKGEGVERGRTE